MLKVEKINKNWRDFRLKDITFEVKNREYFILLGPSGAGKTLLLETIAGIFKPDSGRILMNDEDITFLPPEKRNLSYIPQNYALFTHMTVYDNIAYGLKLKKIPKNEIRSKVLEISEVLGISHLLHRKPKTLSGGEQQRVAIARALILDPSLILLDEPFSSLDVHIRSKLIQEIKVWRKELKFTALHVTHSFEEALNLGDKIGVILDGQLVQYGETKKVFMNPKNEEVARFLGFENIFEGYVERNKLILNGITVRIHNTNKRGRVKVGIKPDSIVVSTKTINTDNVFKGRITALEDLGFLVKLTVNVNDVEFKTFTPRSTFFDGMYDDVFIGFDSSAVYFFD